MKPSVKAFISLYRTMSSRVRYDIQEMTDPEFGEVRGEFQNSRVKVGVGFSRSTNIALQQHHVAATSCCSNIMLQQHHVAATSYCSNIMFIDKTNYIKLEAKFKQEMVLGTSLKFFYLELYSSKSHVDMVFHRCSCSTKLIIRPLFSFPKSIKH
ncbi:hypothetical protein HELRODRAFT_178701 [Helobdella robusta]|uniref:Uncharacterized protein n=1 Tax=Helobdella robusta TaxID=6412 RepID=T1FDL4_HELRO|nr:hypothetical protein HELRODRAFT_178701 [Helobdella robusta]ESN96902.1 hypothetical protein HELRODRAFT_178701 [Helobdella robusta]